MAGRKDFFEFYDDFLGDTIDARWDTNTTGTPTALAVTDDVGAGAASLVLANTSEAEANNMDWGNINSLDLDNGLVFECRLKLTTTISSVAEAFWGLTSDNAASDSITVGAFFKVDGSNDLVLETDDNTNNNDDVATGITLVNDTWYGFQIDLQNLADVKFYIDRGNGWERLASGTTFDMSDQSNAFVQPNFRVDKASGTTVEGLRVDYVWIRGRRYLS